MGGGERKKAAQATEQQAQIGREQADLSASLLREAAPLRSIATKYYTDVAKGGDSLTKAAAPQINQVSRQFQTALKKVREMPLGGARDRAMRELVLGEAGTKAGVYNQEQNRAMQAITTLGEGRTSTGLQGYSAAGSQLSNVAAAYAQMAADKANSWGQAGSAGGTVGASAIAA
jgi:hypothetical protein